ncbi:MAG: hypothetical protein GYA52_13185 [Chloroflexi bacterium]|nr:hypothetical protein [Chloroflexota bacterium]
MDQENIFQVHMPEVDIRPDLKAIFQEARELADQETVLADGTHQRRVVIVSPGRLILLKDSYPPDTLPSENRMVLEDLLPSEKPLKIAVIAYTYLEALRVDIRRAIPFFDYLLGFTYLGHSVWIFEGHSSALREGCRDADYVLVDQRMLPYLDEDWRQIILSENNPANIRMLSVEN